MTVLLVLVVVLVVTVTALLLESDYESENDVDDSVITISGVRLGRGRGRGCDVNCDVFAMLIRYSKDILKAQSILYKLLLAMIQLTNIYCIKLRL